MARAKYDALMNIFEKANPDLSRKKQVEDGQKLWNELKNDPEKYAEKVSQLKLKASKHETQQRKIWDFCKKNVSSSTKSSTSEKKVCYNLYPIEIYNELLFINYKNNFRLKPSSKKNFQALKNLLKPLKRIWI